MPLYVGNMIFHCNEKACYYIWPIYGHGYIWSWSYMGIQYMVNIWPVAYLHCWFFFSFFLTCNVWPIHFINIYRQAYENCVVLESRVCYNVARLMYLNSERCQLCWLGVCAFWIVAFLGSWHSCSVACCRMKTEQSKKYLLHLQAKEHLTSMVYPKPWGFHCCCSVKGCKQVRLRDGVLIRRALAPSNTF